MRIANTTCQVSPFPFPKQHTPTATIVAGVSRLHTSGVANPHAHTYVCAPKPRSVIPGQFVRRRRTTVCTQTKSFTPHPCRLAAPPPPLVHPRIPNHHLPPPPLLLPLLLVGVGLVGLISRQASHHPRCSFLGHDRKTSADQGAKVGLPWCERLTVVGGWSWQSVSSRWAKIPALPYRRGDFCMDVCGEDYWAGMVL